MCGCEGRERVHWVLGTGQVVMRAALLGGYMGGRGRWFPGIVCFVLLLMAARPALANVVLIGKNVSLTFNDMEANFGKMQQAC